MAQIIVSFKSEQEAQEMVNRLSQADLGEVRTRVLDDEGELSYPKNESTAPSMSTNLGSIEVRPSENPEVPEPMHDDQETNMSASIPTTGGKPQGLQLMIEVDDSVEETVREILKAPR